MPHPWLWLRAKCVCVWFDVDTDRRAVRAVCAVCCCCCWPQGEEKRRRTALREARIAFLEEEVPALVARRVELDAIK